MSNATFPNPGLGTFRLNGDTLKQSIKEALSLGYRHIDTAQFYDNESTVGQAIAESDVPRDEIFLTTKIWHDRLQPDAFKAAVDESLSKLGTDYVDLLLIHWPSPEDEVPMVDYLNALSEAKASGKTRHIGVSNFTTAQIDRAIDILGEGELFTNQIEVHPFLQNTVLIDHCQRQGIRITGYMPLAVGKVMEDDTLKAIADAHEVSPAQITLAWLKARDITVIPSSTKASHLKSNLEAFELELSADEMAQIGRLDRAERIASPDFAPNWDE